jgi:hypothetical protein
VGRELRQARRQGLNWRLDTIDERSLIEGSALTLEAVATTEMACFEPVGVIDQEQRYLDVLANVSTDRICQN